MLHIICILSNGDKNFKKDAAVVAIMQLFCFLRHHKDNNYAYTFAAGNMQKL